MFAKSFVYQPAASTKQTSARGLRWMEKWMKRDRPYVDEDSGINGIRKIEGGIKELVSLGSAFMAKYTAAFMRVWTPEMFGNEEGEGFDMITRCLDENGKFIPPPEGVSLYSDDSFDSMSSALFSGLNRFIVAAYVREQNQMNEEEMNGMDALDVESVKININDSKWTLLKDTKTKILQILWQYKNNKKLARNNKEMKVLSPDMIAKMYQNLDKLEGEDMTPLVCAIYDSIFCIFLIL